MKICKQKDCEGKHYARRYCSKHYMRWQRHNNPNIVLIKKHGYYKHPLYTVWKNMKKRCYNKNNKQYKDYGGRGITICDE